MSWSQTIHQIREGVERLKAKGFPVSDIRLFHNILINTVSLAAKPYRICISGVSTILADLESARETALNGNSSAVKGTLSTVGLQTLKSGIKRINNLKIKIGQPSRFSFYVTFLGEIKSAGAPDPLKSLHLILDFGPDSLGQTQNFSKIVKYDILLYLLSL